MRMRVLVAAVSVGVVLTIPGTHPSAQTVSPVLSAMEDELKRSMEGLRLENEPAPYYISYEVADEWGMRASAQLGALVTNTTGRSRTLWVEVRVGDYSFDSSRFVTQTRGGGPGSGTVAVSLPLDDDYASLRRQIWLASDTAYKRAVTTFARKKAAFQNRVITEALPDFSQEAPAQALIPPSDPARTAADWADRVRDVSAAFKTNPDVRASEVWVSSTRATRYFVNSEGSRVVTPVRSATVQISAEAQADDGMVVRDAFSATERELDDLPAATLLMGRAQELSERITRLREAPLGEEYTGPVLLERPASARFLSQTLVQLMLARRAPDSDNIRMAQIYQSQVSPFVTRLGLRVLPDTFSVVDTPSLTEFAGKPVPGAYTVDDEGVPAKDVTLVDKGRLVTLLTGRTPQRRLLRSNGHSRGGTVQAGVFQLKSGLAVPAAELKGKYLELLKLQDKEYGYIIRSIGSEGDGSPEGGPLIFHAVRVYLDGREEIVRGLRFAPVAFGAFKDIVETSVEQTLHSYRAEGGPIVSLIVPDVLFEELEVQKTTDIAQKPPVVTSPLLEATVR
ncbi:MAG: metallopeptidase TldD-related protein [Vicinamibacterales bacterium]